MQQFFTPLLVSLTFIFGSSVAAQSFFDDPTFDQVWTALGKEPLASRYPDGQDIFAGRFGFNLTVPIVVDDPVARWADMYYTVTCELVSSLRTDNPVVGYGTAIIYDNSMGESEKIFPDEDRYSSKFDVDILWGFDMSVIVPMLSLPPYEIEGWTNGSCFLTIAYQPLDGGELRFGAPSDCASNPASGTFAFCSKPGTLSISKQLFGREGFDRFGNIEATE